MELAARAYSLVHRGAHMVQMAGLERVSCSVPAIIRVSRLVPGAPSVSATGRVVGGTVRTRRDARKLDFSKSDKLLSTPASAWTTPSVGVAHATACPVRHREGP